MNKNVFLVNKKCSLGEQECSLDDLLGEQNCSLGEQKCSLDDPLGEQNCSLGEQKCSLDEILHVTFLQIQVSLSSKAYMNKNVPESFNGQ